MIRCASVLLIVFVWRVLSPAAAEVMRLDYEGFTIWLDCERRGAVKFRYNAQRDHGSFKRLKSFYRDPAVPGRCQQTSTASYKHPDERYDRGHLVPANHLDNDAKAIKQSNYMTNILPQAASMNRGAWLRTEEIVECYRDIEELLVLGGVIWGNDPTDDHFVDSHGVAPRCLLEAYYPGSGPHHRMDCAERKDRDAQTARSVSGDGGRIAAANGRAVPGSTAVCQV